MGLCVARIKHIQGEIMKKFRFSGILSLLIVALGMLAACQSRPLTGTPDMIAPSPTAVMNEAGTPVPTPAAPTSGVIPSAPAPDAPVIPVEMPTVEVHENGDGFIPADTTLVPFYDGITSVAIQNFHQTQYEAAPVDGRIEVYKRLAGDTSYSSILSLSQEDLPLNLSEDIWVSTQGLHVRTAHVSAFHVRLFLGGNDTFTVKPLTPGLPSEFAVQVSYMAPNEFTLEVYENGASVGLSRGYVCPEGCQVKVDTSRLSSTYTDQLEGYFFFATGWNDTPQFVFPLGWAPAP